MLCFILLICMILGIFICVWWMFFIVRLGFCGWIFVSLSILLFSSSIFTVYILARLVGLLSIIFWHLVCRFIFLKVASSTLRWLCVFPRLQQITSRLWFLSASGTILSVFLIWLFILQITNPEIASVIFLTTFLIYFCICVFYFRDCVLQVFLLFWMICFSKIACGRGFHVSVQKSRLCIILLHLCFLSFFCRSQI